MKMLIIDYQLSPWVLIAIPIMVTVAAKATIIVAAVASQFLSGWIISVLT